MQIRIFIYILYIHRISNLENDLPCINHYKRRTYHAYTTISVLYIVSSRTKNDHKHVNLFILQKLTNLVWYCLRIRHDSHKGFAF